MISETLFEKYAYICNQIPHELGSRDDLIREIEDLKEIIRYLNEILLAMEKTSFFLVKKYDDLVAANKEHKRKLNVNSSNSNWPKSRDMPWTKINTRTLMGVSNRKPGGQPHHKGANIHIPDKVDEIVYHYPRDCEGCNKIDECFRKNGSDGAEKRYVIDIVMTKYVTEHRRLKWRCPLCRRDKELHSKPYFAGVFPEEVSAPVQYGKSLEAASAIMNGVCDVSLSQTSQIFKEVFDVTIAASTVESMVERAGEACKSANESIKEMITNSYVVHFDETGSKIKGDPHWMHVSSNEKGTYLSVHKKRGREGIEHNGVIQRFRGVAVHDCFGSYSNPDYECEHALCNAHILRELTAATQNEPGHTWSQSFLSLLLAMKSEKERALSEGRTSLDKRTLDILSDEFDRIMTIADNECPLPPETDAHKRGRRPKGIERSLAERLMNNKDSVCRFVYDFSVPFDNNQAERDLRKIKKRLKVGGFRTLAGAENYLAITSYVSTARKNDVSPFKAIISALNGHPMFTEWKCSASAEQQRRSDAG